MNGVRALRFAASAAQASARRLYARRLRRLALQRIELGEEFAEYAEVIRRLWFRGGAKRSVACRVSMHPVSFSFSGNVRRGGARGG